MCLVVFVACSATDPADPIASSTTAPAAAATTTTRAADAGTNPPETVIPSHPDLSEFGVLRASIDGNELWLAVADTRELRSRGLMGITDLAPLDGMLFIFESETSGGFWMKDTLIPLDIAWFDADGELVRALTMVPCESDPCPSYAPGAAYLYAVEVPGGAFADLSSSATLDF